MNVPNLLSLLRIILTPIIILLMLLYPVNNTYCFLNCVENTISIGNGKIPVVWLVALVLFIIASLTDFIDGYIARKYNLVTDLGKFLDPIADKILITSVMIVMTVAQIIPVWILLIIVSRDLVIGVLREIGAKRQVTIAADKLGKWKTTIQMIGLIVLFLLNNVFFNWKQFSWENQVALIPMYVASLLTVISMVNYIYKNKKLFLNEEKKNG